MQCSWLAMTYTVDALCCLLLMLIQLHVTWLFFTDFEAIFLDLFVLDNFVLVVLRHFFLFGFI